jgi:hypothetical protein
MKTLRVPGAQVSSISGNKLLIMGEHNKTVRTNTVDFLFVANTYSFLHKGIQKIQLYSLCLPPF